MTLATFRYATRLGQVAILVSLVVLASTYVGHTAQAATAPKTEQEVEQSAARATPWAWPIAPPHSVIRPYLAPATRYSSGHRGIDIAAEAGASISAPTDGQIYFVGFVVDRAVMTVRNRDGSLSSFEPAETTLTVGTVVHRGDPIGTVSTSSHCATSCLHFGLRINGSYVSPLRYLGGISLPVLLPNRTK